MKENKNTPREATSPLETFGRQIADFIINSPCQLAIDIRKAVRGEAQTAQTPQPSQTAPAAKTPKNPRQPKLEDLGWVENTVAQRMLGISRRALQTHRSKGGLPFSQFGNKIYFRLEDIIRALENGYTGNLDDNDTKGGDQ
ncbi:MAG: helix-turn-helix domain-containing protein [Bacteroidales bacterium]|nr:helix-turn-helix domain-containing protein [Bacteroidales bacterium]